MDSMSRRSDLLRQLWSDGSHEFLRALRALDGFDYDDALERDYA
jgi:hypothetical protein